MDDLSLQFPSKPHVCQRCDRGFARLEHLQRHERSHTKEKPFRCSGCPKGFTRRDLLTRHIRLSHPTTEPSENSLPIASGRERDASISQPQVQTIASSIEDQQLGTPPQASAHLYDHSDVVAAADQAIGHGFLQSVPDYSFRMDLDDSQFDPFASAFNQDFGAFMDSVPTLAHPFSLTHQPLPVLFSDLPPLPPTNVEEVVCEQACVGIVIPAAATSLSNSSASESSLSRYGSRLPSLAPENGRELVHTKVQSSSRHHRREFFVSAECRQTVLDQLAAFPNCVAHDFVLPSRHGLSRLIGGYFHNFHDHYPFFHTPTLQLETLKPDLLLAVAALGARYTREPDTGIELYRIARSVALERISRRHMGISQGSTSGATPGRAGQDDTPKHHETLELMQTLLLLIAVASWYKHEPAAQDALSIRSVLHSLTREIGMTEKPKQLLDDWKTWTTLETLKRTLLVIYCFFNIHTILFDLPPMMLNRELNIDLPCSEQEWKASSEAEWRAVNGETGVASQGFQDTYSSLFSSNYNPHLSTKGFSALGGYALIHAIIQQIWLVRNGRMPAYEQTGNGLSRDEMKIFERALKRWTGRWERNQESSMNPLSPHGPLTFTSTALLRLAYIRVNMDLGPVRSLNSWDPNVVARSLHQSPGARRGDQMTRAALHCAHALSIPVKLGINYVAQTQLIHWSNQHALCSLECAVLLAKWLEAITMPGVTPDFDEQRVLEFTAQLVTENEYQTSYERILEQKPQLSGRVVRLWAKLYQSKSVWQTVNLIGESLNIYAALLEADH